MRICSPATHLSKRFIAPSITPSGFPALTVCHSHLQALPMCRRIAARILPSSRVRESSIGRQAPTLTGRLMRLLGAGKKSHRSGGRDRMERKSYSGTLAATWSFYLSLVAVLRNWPPYTTLCPSFFKPIPVEPINRMPFSLMVRRKKMSRCFRRRQPLSPNGIGSMPFLRCNMPPSRISSNISTSITATI